MQDNSNFQMKVHWLWVVPILLFSFALAIPHIQTHALWFDEAYTHLYTGSGRLAALDTSIFDTIVLIARNNPSWPPAYFVLQNIWSQFAGNTLTSEHMLPLLAGILGVAMMYRFSKALYGEIGGILASLLFGTSAFYIHFMHETRAYTIYTLFVMIVGWFYWMLVHRSSIKPRWLSWGFSIMIALALYTHYVAGAFILGIGFYHFFFQHPSRSHKPYMSPYRWKAILRLWMNGCLLFSPWIAVLITHLAVETGQDRALPFLDLIQSAIYGFSNNLWFFVVPILLGSLWFHKRDTIRFLWVWTIIAIIVIAFVNTFASFLFHPRHILALLIIFILLFVATLLEINKRSSLVCGIIVFIWVVAGSFYSSSLDFMSKIPNHTIPLSINLVEEMQATVDSCVAEEDAVIFGIDAIDANLNSAIVAQYYFFDRLDTYFLLTSLIYSYENSDIFIADEESIYQQRIIEEVGRPATIWLMTAPSLALNAEVTRFSGYLQEENYLQCPYSTRYTDTWFYTTEDNCELVLSSCQ